MTTHVEKGEVDKREEDVDTIKKEICRKWDSYCSRQSNLIIQ